MPEQVSEARLVSLCCTKCVNGGEGTAALRKGESFNHCGEDDSETIKNY